MPAPSPTLLYPCSTELPPYTAKAGAGREIEQLDVSLTSVLARLAEHRRRRTFLLAFAQSPVDFIQALVAAHVSRACGSAKGILGLWRALRSQQRC